MANEGLAELRNRYGQEQMAAQESGIQLPPFPEWIKQRQAIPQMPPSNKLASLMPVR